MPATPWARPPTRPRVGAAARTCLRLSKYQLLTTSHPLFPHHPPGQRPLGTPASGCRRPCARGTRPRGACPARTVQCSMCMSCAQHTRAQHQHQSTSNSRESGHGAFKHSREGGRARAKWEDESMPLSGQGGARARALAVTRSKRRGLLRVSWWALRSRCTCWASIWVGTMRY